MTLPYPVSTERTRREDGVYDVVVVLGHNDGPPVPGLGSAILHFGKRCYPPAEGCVAITRANLEDLLDIAAVGDAPPEPDPCWVP
ncbi:MAG: hypothetical protein U0838_13675 [Chloroflexota bacterium]